MEAALLFLCVTGGYFYSIIFQPSLYSASREDGHRLYFRAAYYAFFLVVWSVEIYLILFLYEIPVASLHQAPNHTPEGIFELLHWLLKTKHAQAVVSVFAFLLGITVPHLFNFIVRKTGSKSFFLERAIENDDFESMLYFSVKHTIPVLVTMDCFTVYVGWCTKLDNPIINRRFVKLMPLLNGYRESDNHEPIFTTNYGPIYDLCEKVNPEKKEGALRGEDFEVVLAVERIVSVHKFDLTNIIEHDLLGIADIVPTGDRRVEKPSTNKKDQDKEKEFTSQEGDDEKKYSLTLSLGVPKKS